jgi:hypothetical protein
MVETMSDKELLKLAAKSAGITVLRFDGDMPVVPSSLTASGLGYWRPLTDDGDALRLAVKLGIFIQPNTNQADPFVRALCWPSGVGRIEEVKDGTDANAAARRAIVRAAATIATTNT